MYCLKNFLFVEWLNKILAIIGRSSQLADKATPYVIAQTH